MPPAPCEEDIDSGMKKVNFDTLSLQEQRHHLLRQALPNVPYEGWTWDAFVPIEQDLSITRETTQRLFDFKDYNMVVTFAELITVDMMAELEKIEKPKGITARIALALKTRLNIMKPHKEAIRRMTNQPKSTLKVYPKTTWATADKIWHYAGDTAKDYNHYTKRTLLAAIYTTTLLYWLNDTSENHQQTQDFITRQLKTVVKTGQTAKHVIEGMGRTVDKVLGKAKSLG